MVLLTILSKDYKGKTESIIAKLDNAERNVLICFNIVCSTHINWIDMLN